jgi:hypothetical protein
MVVIFWLREEGSDVVLNAKSPAEAPAEQPMARIPDFLDLSPVAFAFPRSEERTNWQPGTTMCIINITLTSLFYFYMVRCPDISAFRVVAKTPTL